MGETKWEKGVETASCDILRFPAVSWGFLQFSAVFRSSKPLTLQIKDQICKNLQQSSTSCRFSLLVAPIQCCPIYLSCTVRKTCNIGGSFSTYCRRKQNIDPKSCRGIAIQLHIYFLSGGFSFRKPHSELREWPLCKFGWVGARWATPWSTTGGGDGSRCRRSWKGQLKEGQPAWEFLRGFGVSEGVFEGVSERTPADLSEEPWYWRTSHTMSQRSLGVRLLSEIPSECHFPLRVAGPVAPNRVATWNSNKSQPLSECGFACGLKTETCQFSNISSC